MPIARATVEQSWPLPAQARHPPLPERSLDPRRPASVGVLDWRELQLPACPAPARSSLLESLQISLRRGSPTRSPRFSTQGWALLPGPWRPSYFSRLPFVEFLPRAKQYSERLT